MITVQTPNDRSILSVIPCNSMAHGEQFRKDGWVYDADDKRLRKWFVQIKNHRVWVSKIEDKSLLAQLEASRYYIAVKANARMKQAWEDFCAKFKKAGCLIKGKKNGEDVIVEGNDHPDGSFGIGVKYWCNARYRQIFDEAVENQALVDDYFACDSFRELNGNRKWFANHAFMRAIDNHFRVDVRNPTLHLVINGRHYWFAPTNNKYESNSWDVISYPEQERICVI